MVDNKVPSLPLVSLSQIELRALIGAGRTGRVYTSSYHNHDVAVRRFDQSLRLLGTLDALKVEMSAICALRHANLLRTIALVLDGSQAVGTLMQYAPRSLQDAIEEVEAPLLCAYPEMAVRMAKQVAQGLAHLHTNGLLHGCLRPSNVRLGGEDGFEVKLTDHGRSKRLITRLAEISASGAEDDDRATVTEPERLPQSYMAPELLAGERWNSSADIYSLGCLIARLGSSSALYSKELRQAAGHFQGPWKGVFNLICSGALSPVAGMQAELPPSLALLASECTDLERRKRPRTMHCVRGLTLIEAEQIPSQELSQESHRDTEQPQPSRRGPPRATYTGQQYITPSRLPAPGVTRELASAAPVPPPELSPPRSVSRYVSLWRRAGQKVQALRPAEQPATQAPQAPQAPVPRARKDSLVGLGGVAALASRGGAGAQPSNSMPEQSAPGLRSHPAADVELEEQAALRVRI